MRIMGHKYKDLPVLFKQLESFRTMDPGILDLIEEYDGRIAYDHCIGNQKRTGLPARKFCHPGCEDDRFPGKLVGKLQCFADQPFGI